MSLLKYCCSLFCSVFIYCSILDLLGRATANKLNSDPPVNVFTFCVMLQDVALVIETEWDPTWKK